MTLEIQVSGKEIWPILRTNNADRNDFFSPLYVFIFFTSVATTVIILTSVIEPSKNRHVIQLTHVNSATLLPAVSSPGGIQFAKKKTSPKRSINTTLQNLTTGDWTVRFSKEIVRVSEKMALDTSENYLLYMKPFMPIGGWTRNISTALTFKREESCRELSMQNLLQTAEVYPGVPNLSPYTCAQLCVKMSFPFFGLLNASICWCRDYLEDVPQKAVKVCEVLVCPGDILAYCGSAVSSVVYRITSPMREIIDMYVPFLFIAYTFLSFLHPLPHQLPPSSNFFASVQISINDFYLTFPPFILSSPPTPFPPLPPLLSPLLQ